MPEHPLDAGRRADHQQIGLLRGDPIWVRHVSGEVGDASLEQFRLLFAGPHQGRALYQHEHLVLLVYMWKGGGFAFADVKPADGQLPVGGLAVEQDPQRAAVEPGIDSPKWTIVRIGTLQRRSPGEVSLAWSSCSTVFRRKLTGRRMLGIEPDDRGDQCRGGHCR
jgi:hypothetical protein